MRGSRERAGRWMAAVLAVALGVVAAGDGARAAERANPPLAPTPSRTTASAEPATLQVSAAKAGASVGPEIKRQYAEREARNPQAAGFRGGDSVGIYIGGGAGLIIVLLLVLLLVR